MTTPNARSIAQIAHCACVLGLTAGSALAHPPGDLLPDITVTESHLYDNQIRNEGGRIVLRMSNGTPNIGDGPLHLYGGADLGNGTQEVIQRVFNADGSFYDRVAGSFIYHPTHSHIHVENWCVYRLREILPGDGVGDIVAEGAKTSFCVLDLGLYDSSLPNFDPSPDYTSCGSTTQGLSVGWLDVYSKGLDGQLIDISDVPDGEYWLESEVDPNDNFLELDETNNAKRIKVSIGGTTTIQPDAYEPNETATATASRPVGAPASPNLGPAGPQLVVGGLTIHNGFDYDHFRFYMPATGTSNDFIRINFFHGQGDLDFKLMNASGSVIATSDGVTDSEQISLSGRAAGWYTAQVYGFSGATSPNYTLTINPSQNAAPTITVINPPTGNIDLDHGGDTYTATWSASDPESNEMWVTLWLADHPFLDGHEVLMPTSVNTPASQGFYIINSAYVMPGTYWVYAEVTDGGTVTGAWSDGTITFLDSTGCLGDWNNSGGQPDSSDFLFYLNDWVAQDSHADLAPPGGDGVWDSSDFLAYLNVFVAGC